MQLKPMALAEMILSEFDQEMGKTRKVLERIPEDKLEWRAHPKSNTIGWNANHLTELPGWAEGTLTTGSFDVAPPGGERYQTPRLTSRQEILHPFRPERRGGAQGPGGDERSADV